ncbi:hypothetical protein GH153_00060 [bacterium]|nr:hypothetical protein [bacterium]
MTTPQEKISQGHGKEKKKQTWLMSTGKVGTKTTLKWGLINPMHKQDKAISNKSQAFNAPVLVGLILDQQPGVFFVLRIYTFFLFSGSMPWVKPDQARA